MDQALAGALTVLGMGLACALLVAWAARRAARRDEAAAPPLPPCPPPADELLPATPARYLGTTYAPSTVRRFAGYGLLGRGVVTLSLDRAALRVARGDGSQWCVPVPALRGAAAAAQHAGKRAGPGRVLVVDWALGPLNLRSGFVLDEATTRRFVAALEEVTVP